MPILTVEINDDLHRKLVIQSLTEGRSIDLIVAARLEEYELLQAGEDQGEGSEGDGTQPDPAQFVSQILARSSSGIERYRPTS